MGERTPGPFLAWRRSRAAATTGVARRLVGLDVTGVDLGRSGVLVDHGHDPPALKALAETLLHLASGRFLDTALGTGNRRATPARRP